MTMVSMINIDWVFILFTVLVFGSSAGALLCFRHMLHEGYAEEKHDKDSKREHELGAPIQY